MRLTLVFPALVVMAVTGVFVTGSASAQGMEPTTTMQRDQIVRVQPETGATQVITTETRVSPVKDAKVSPDYQHDYYSYSETFNAPVLVYGSIEEPVVIDNGPDVTPIRTLSR